MSPLVKSIKIHCDGNPFSAVSSLRNMVIPESVHSDIIDKDGKGQHKQFFENRLVRGASSFMWDRMTQMRLEDVFQHGCKEYSS